VIQISALIDIHYTLHKAVSDPGVPRGDALRLPSMRSESTMIEVLNPKTRDEVDMVIDLYSEASPGQPCVLDELNLAADEYTEGRSSCPHQGAG
jgi:hypothetical protein